MFYVYILWSDKLSRFYTGTTDDVDKRLAEHNNHRYTEAFTAKGIPWILFLFIRCDSSQQAYLVEKHIKKMKSATYIRNLKKYPEMIEKLLLKYK